MVEEEQLKEKLENYSSDDFGHNTTPELDEVMKKVEKDVKKAVLHFEYILKEFDKLANVTYTDINKFKSDFCKTLLRKHKEIFGNWEK